MPSGTNILTFAADDAKMRWREPYVTEGLNRKVNRIVPRGIYAGFYLGAHASNRTVNVVADSSNEHLAVYNTSTGYSLTVRKTGGNFALDLTPFAGSLVYIAIFASYAIANTTVAEIRAYTVAQYNAATEKDELLVLGKVNVPAGAIPIPAADITASERDLPFDNILPGGEVWFPLVQNGSFEMNPAAVVHPTSPSATVVVPNPTNDEFFSRFFPNWTIFALLSVNQAIAQIVDTDNSGDGGSKCFAFDISAAGASTLTEFYLRPDVFLVQSTSEREFRVKFAYKSPYAPTAGNITVWVTFVDDEKSGAVPVGVSLGNLDLSASASWKVFDYTFKAPVGQRMLTGVWLYSGSLANPAVPVTAALSYTTVGVNQNVFKVDDFQVHALFSTRKPDEIAVLRRKTELVSALVFEERGVDAEDAERRLVLNREEASFDWLGTARQGLAMRSDDGNSATGANVSYLRSSSFVGFYVTGVVPRFIGGGTSSPLDRVPILSGSSGPPTALPQFVVYTGETTLKGMSTTVGAFLNAAGLWAAGTVVGTIGGAQDSAFRVDVGGITMPDSGNPGQGFRILRRANPVAGTWAEAGWSQSIILPIKDDDAAFIGLDMLGYMPCGLDLGAGIAGGSNDEQVPRVRLHVESPDTYTLAQDVVGATGGNNFWRLYSGQISNSIVTGAYWSQTPAQWNADDPGVLQAFRLKFDGATGTITINMQDTNAVGTWVDGDWNAFSSGGDINIRLQVGFATEFNIANTQVANQDDGVSHTLTGTGRQTFFRVNGGFTTAETSGFAAGYGSTHANNANALYKSNIVKAYATVASNGAAQISVKEAFGIDTISLPGDGSILVRTLRDFINFPTITATGHDSGGTPYAAVVTAVTVGPPTTFRIRLVNLTTGTYSSFDGTSLQVSFSVIGDVI